MPETPPDPVGQRRRVGLLAAVAMTATLLDLISKLLVVAHLTPGNSRRILGGLIYLSLGRNPGAAFGMATGLTVVFALIAVVAVVAIIRIATRLRSVLWALALGLVLGGVIGNLIDRLFRAPGFLRGAVVDWISVFGPNGEHFPAFNLADSAITVGAILLIVTTLLGIPIDGRRSG